MKISCLSVLLLLGGTSIARADCQADFNALMEAHLKAGPYHTSTRTTTGDTVHEFESDIVLPLRYHIKSGEHETIMGESIFTENGAWSKIGNGGWVQIPEATAAEAVKSFKRGLSGGLKSMRNLSCLGAQPMEGKSYNAYGFDIDAYQVISRSYVASQGKLFSGENNLPAILKIESTSTVGTSNTVQHIRYDPSIKIDPPKL